jgi:hypothetical protein
MISLDPQNIDSIANFSRVEKSDSVYGIHDTEVTKGSISIELGSINNSEAESFWVSWKLVVRILICRLNQKE